MRVAILKCLSLIFALFVIAGAPGARAAEWTPYTKASFQELLKSGKPVLVHTHAGWCPVCKRQEQVLGELSNEKALDGLTLVRVDFDKDTDFLAEQKAGRSVILIFRDGKEVVRVANETAKDRIRAGLKLPGV